MAHIQGPVALAVTLGAAAALPIQRGIELISIPDDQRHPLPDGLTAMESQEGQGLLSSAIRGDLEIVSAHFVPQQRPQWGGVASVAIARNALVQANSSLGQDAIFENVPDPLLPIRATWQGLTLPEVARLLQMHGLAVDVHYAADANPRALRASLVDTVADRSDLMLAVFDRGVLGEVGGWHVAPVAALHEGADQILVVDPAVHVYPSAWVGVDSMFQAMASTDPRAEASGGWIVARAAEGTNSLAWNAAH